MKDEFRKRSKSASAKPDVRLAVTGAPRVGKSAISVRFLTRRFIGEYQRNVERVYRKNIQFGNDVIEYDLKDASGTSDTSSLINWATCIAVIYSITDRASFILASTQLEEIDTMLHLQNNKYQALSPCIALIGNKKDLDHIREVPHDEGRDFAKLHGASFWEVSASEDYHSTHVPLNSLIVESYLNFVTAQNTDSNSNATTLDSKLKKEQNDVKPRAKSENLGLSSNRSSYNSDLDDFEQRKDFFQKKQEEDAINSKETKKKKKLTSEIRKQLDLKLNENKPRRRKISHGKYSLDSQQIEIKKYIESPDPRNENVFVDEQPRSNSWSKKDKKRTTSRKSEDTKLEPVRLIKSKSYSDLKSYAIEENERKVSLTPQLSRVKKLATEFDKNGGYKERRENELGTTVSALLSPGEKPGSSASFTNLASFSTIDMKKHTMNLFPQQPPKTAPKPQLMIARKTPPKPPPRPSPKLKRERRKIIVDSVDENDNISSPEKKSPETEKIPMKLKKSETKKSIRRKLSSIFRPNVIQEN